MNLRKRLLAVSTIFLSVAGFSSSASAQGIPVIDVANLGQAIQQVSAWQQQYSQMQTQITQMTGNRGMGGLLSGQNGSYLPPDWNSAMSALSNGGGTSYGQLASNAKQILNSQAVLQSSDINNLSPDMQQYLSTVRNMSASQQALGQAAYANSAQRVSLLQTLTNQINTSTDPKAIMDLHATIASEQNKLANDQAQLQSVAQLTNAQQQANASMQNEMRAQTAGTGNFPNLDTSVGN
ncbi:type IV secretion system protein [Caballeronia sordidicola]|uniref:Minor pilin of type IV secretion complex, VirB5 n=1 Tax=Caballeronia sordidicola TaxID=196367 RepID=A0A242MVC9_CABSO|nr:type IV secretion system protein [Caballeronia sordidicola]OTP75387.1 Minor pilin of type IV secretion complex, VirB5 [Caballeronia sordidicola]